ncbi:MAG TPA: nucleotide exchange factor GrpE [Gammaproteobacteria bacterium]|nr:nucleotide exchange factor GrpE [Gammaproteobacteria bacterium]
MSEDKEQARETDNATEAGDAGAPATETEGGEDHSGKSHEELLLTLQDAQAKADEYWNQLLRAKADLENLQRRAQRDLENAHKFALEKFVRELLPVVDSLELGLAAARAENADLSKVVEGMDLTLKMLQGVLEKFGVRVVNPAGEKFDPEHHQAMTTQPSNEVAPNTVLNVYQKGYTLNDRLIRPAMVVVSSSAGDGEAPGEAPDAPSVDEMA